MQPTSTDNHRIAAVARLDGSCALHLHLAPSVCEMLQFTTTRRRSGKTEQEVEKRSVNKLSSIYSTVVIFILLLLLFIIIESARKSRGIGPQTRWMDSSRTESAPSVFYNIVATISLFACNPYLLKIIILILINGKAEYGLFFLIRREWIARIKCWEEGGTR